MTTSRRWSTRRRIGWRAGWWCFRSWCCCCFIPGAARRRSGSAAMDTTGIDARLRVDYAGFSLDVDLRLPGRGVTALYGHSGSGKTTFLRCVAGLASEGKGYLSVNGQVWLDTASGVRVPTHRRALGYVFQEASLFPHLDVLRNLEYGRKRVPA